MPLDVLESYGFNDNGHGIWEYTINDKFSILVNRLSTDRTGRFVYSDDNVVRLYYYGEMEDSFGYVEDLVTMPEVIYLLIRDGVVSVC